MNVLHDDLLQSCLYYGWILGDFSNLIVIIVAREQGLNGLASQGKEVLFERIVLHISPLFIDVLLIKVIFLGRHEGSSDPLMRQVIPSKVFQPRMVLDFVGTSIAKSVLWLSLYHLKWKKRKMRVQCQGSENNDLKCRRLEMEFKKHGIHLLC